MRIAILTGLMVLLLTVVSSRAAGPDESKWLINYPVPEDVKAFVVTLSYCWWDPKVEGDVPSKKVLLTTEKVVIKPRQKMVPIQILLNGGKSVVTVGTQVFRGRGRLLDTSFVRAKEPKPNFDGFYILAQQSVDAKKPAPMGQTGDASAWIELGIDLQP